MFPISTEKIDHLHRQPYSEKRKRVKVVNAADVVHRHQLRPLKSFAMNDFQDNFNHFTGDLFKDFQSDDWENMVVSGGAVVCKYSFVSIES